jgi:hypothetical protein
MLGLTVYADESGTHDEFGEQSGSEVTAIAGYIGTQRDWETVTRRWNTALKKFGVEVFHMSEYWRKEPPYDTWPNGKRKRFLSTLISIARDNTLFTVGGMVATKDWVNHLPEGLKDGKRGGRNFRHPYHFCFQMFLVRFMEYLKSDIDKRFQRSEGKEEEVAFVFDHQQEFEKIAQKTFQIVKGEIDPENRFTQITFASGEGRIPLQAADLLVFYARRMLTHQNQGKICRDPFEKMLMGRGNVHLHYYSRREMSEFSIKVNARRQTRMLKAVTTQ